MINEYELKQAIEECQSQPNPNANTCIKLASYLTILDNLTKSEGKNYSYSNGIVSGSEFGKIAQTKDADAVMRLIDELVSTVQIVNPRLYDSFIVKLLEL